MRWKLSSFVASQVIAKDLPRQSLPSLWRSRNNAKPFVSSWHLPHHSAPSAFHTSTFVARQGGTDDKVDQHDDDPYHLQDRFVATHKVHFRQALAEIQAGRKTSHWSWFIFPTPPYLVNGREAGSPINRYYALRSDDQAMAFLRLPETAGGVDLRQNYITIMRAVAEQLEQNPHLTVRQLVGPADCSKLKSSLTYFAYISSVMDPPDAEVHQVCHRALDAVKRAS